MHRAGTSLVARIFYEWGVNLGKDLMKGDVANPEGFYENWDFVNLNSTLLKENNAEWNYPKIIKRPDIRCKKLIEEHRDTLWGWKDNRTAFTFPAYEPFLENVLFVVCLRDKEAITNSLMRTHKGQFKPEDQNKEYFYKLTDMYYKAIDEISKDYPRIDIRYKDLKGNKYFNLNLEHF